MPKLNWNDELSVGVPMIDSQHQELIRIANLIIDALKREDSRDDIDMVVGKLREYTVFHFRCEEELMARIRYPARADQEREHLRLKKEVKEFQRKLYLQENIPQESILEFVKDWLIKHILAFDRDLARYIQEQEAEEKAKKTKESQKDKGEGPKPE